MDWHVWILFGVRRPLGWDCLLWNESRWSDRCFVPFGKRMDKMIYSSNLPKRQPLSGALENGNQAVPWKASCSFIFSDFWCVTHKKHVGFAVAIGHGKLLVNPWICIFFAARRQVFQGLGRDCHLGMVKKPCMFIVWGWCRVFGWFYTLSTNETAFWKLIFHSLIVFTATKIVLQPAPLYIDNAHNTEAFNASKQIKTLTVKGSPVEGRDKSHHRFYCRIVGP